THLVHPLGTAATRSEARNEFDDCVVIVCLRVPFQVEAEPFHCSVFGEAKRSGARTRMPGIDQIRLESQYVGAIARAHQFVCALRHGALMEPAAAFGVAATGAAGASRATFYHRVMGL